MTDYTMLKLNRLTTGEPTQDVYVYDGVRRVNIERYNAVNLMTGEVVECTYDCDWCSWTVIEDVYGSENKIWAEYNEQYSEEAHDDIIVANNTPYKVIDIIGDYWIDRIDDNYSDFLSFGTKLEEMTVDEHTGCEYHRITVKQGEGFVTTIFCLTDDDEYIEYSGEVAKTISECNNWELVDIT